MIKNKIRLKKLKIENGLKEKLPLFYHFIHFNKLETGDPFDYSEFSEYTKSLVFFERREEKESERKKNL